jgi:hypothetical protein
VSDSSPLDLYPTLVTVAFTFTLSILAFTLSMVSEKPCLVRDYLAVKKSLRGSQRVALRLSRESLVLILFLIFSVGVHERTRRMQPLSP